MVSWNLNTLHLGVDHPPPCSSSAQGTSCSLFRGSPPWMMASKVFAKCIQQKHIRVSCFQISTCKIKPNKTCIYKHVVYIYIYIRILNIYIYIKTRGQVSVSNKCAKLSIHLSLNLLPKTPPLLRPEFPWRWPHGAVGKLRNAYSL